MRRRVVIVLYEGFQLLDLAGPADMFGMAGLCSGGAGYEVELTAVDAEAVMAHAGQMLDLLVSGCARQDSNPRPSD